MLYVNNHHFRSQSEILDIMYYSFQQQQIAEPHVRKKREGKYNIRDTQTIIISDI